MKQRVLDPQTTDEVLELLLKINQELNLTVVLITHEMHVIRKICNRVAVMEYGEIVEEGKVIDIFKSLKQKLRNALSNKKRIKTLKKRNWLLKKCWNNIRMENCSPTFPRRTSEIANYLAYCPRISSRSQYYSREHSANKAGCSGFSLYSIIRRRAKYSSSH